MNVFSVSVGQKLLRFSVKRWMLFGGQTTFSL